MNTDSHIYAAIVDAIEDGASVRDLGRTLAALEWTRYNYGIPTFDIARAQLEHPTPDLVRAFHRIAGNHVEIALMASALSGAIPPEDFFSPGHYAAIEADAAAEDELVRAIAGAAAGLADGIVFSRDPGERAQRLAADDWARRQLARAA